MNFAQPGWLALLILLPLLATGAVMVSRMRRGKWTAFVAPRLRDSLLKTSGKVSRWLALFLLLAACGTLILALARPRGDAGTRTEKTMGRNVMIALDISKSMKVSDVKPDRLAQAKVVIYELLEAMPNERIGFIAFAGNPYEYAPLTIDHGAVREIVEQIDENWAPLGGSDLAAAVQLATESLKKTGQKNNALIILSDGEENDGELEEMIAQAEQSGVYIITIGVGTEDGGFVPDPNFPEGKMVDRSGRTVISQLQTDVLRKLAEDTRGRFAMAGSGLDIPALVSSVVKGLDAFEMEGRERRISVEFYQWLLLPGIVFLAASIVTGTRWRGVRTALVAAVGFLTASGVDANESTRAKEALTDHRNEEARAAYHTLAEKSTARETRARYRLGEATAAYRSGDFRAARSAFSGSLLSEDRVVLGNGHLGMGNSMFQLGWKSLSGEAYPADPAAVPDLDRFDTIVKEALAELRESESADDESSKGGVKFESLVTNWADAVRHYDSALTHDPSGKVATGNRVMTMTYLKRLQELLKQEEEDTQQAMSQAQPGEGPPQEGEGEGEPQEGNGEGEENPDGKGGEGEEEKDGSGKEGEREKDGKQGKGDKEDPDKKGDKDDADPNESPQERAGRILKENADLEKGPLNPGRREFRRAAKDW